MAIKDNLIIIKKITANQRKVLKMLDNDNVELVFSKGGGWWIGDEQIYSSLAKSLIQYCMVSLDQFSKTGHFERYTINETGKLSLRTGLLYRQADFYNPNF